MWVFFLNERALFTHFILKEAGGPKSKAIAEWMEEALETWFYENKDLEAVEVKWIDHSQSFTTLFCTTVKLARLVNEWNPIPVVTLVKVADFLGDIIASEFRLQIEDGSLRQVIWWIWTFITVCKSLNIFVNLKKFLTMANFRWGTGFVNFSESALPTKVSKEFLTSFRWQSSWLLRG